jgi:hypothetical protein
VVRPFERLRVTQKRLALSGFVLHPPTPDALRRVLFLWAERNGLQPSQRGCDGDTGRGASWRAWGLGR